MAIKLVCNLVVEKNNCRPRQLQTENILYQSRAVQQIQDERQFQYLFRILQCHIWSDNYRLSQSHMFDLNEQELTSFKKAFDLFDKDGNGKINKEEITTVFKELNIKLQPQDIDKIIKQFDQNGDQCIEFEEFITVLTNNIDKSQSQAWLVEVFQIIDQDCDGLLSKSELEKVNKLYNLQIPQKEINQILQTFEGQEAGINYQEFASLLRNL